MDTLASDSLRKEAQAFLLAQPDGSLAFPDGLQFIHEILTLPTNEINDGFPLMGVELLKRHLKRSDVEKNRAVLPAMLNHAVMGRYHPLHSSSILHTSLNQSVENAISALLTDITPVTAEEAACVALSLPVCACKYLEQAKQKGESAPILLIERTMAGFVRQSFKHEHVTSQYASLLFDFVDAVGAASINSVILHNFLGLCTIGHATCELKIRALKYWFDKSTDPIPGINVGIASKPSMFTYTNRALQVIMDIALGKEPSNPNEECAFIVQLLSDSRSVTTDIKLCALKVLLRYAKECYASAKIAADAFHDLNIHAWFPYYSSQVLELAMFLSAWWGINAEIVHKKTIAQTSSDSHLELLGVDNVVVAGKEGYTSARLVTITSSSQTTESCLWKWSPEPLLSVMNTSMVGLVQAHQDKLETLVRNVISVNKLGYLETPIDIKPTLRTYSALLLELFMSECSV